MRPDNPDNPDCPPDNGSRYGPSHNKGYGGGYNGGGSGYNGGYSGYGGYGAAYGGDVITAHPAANNETWLTSHWRPVAAAVYLFICVFDFVLMPSYNEWANTKMPPDQMVKIVAQLDNPTAQVEALKVLEQSRTWEPLTLQQSGLFHISFGAILGAAAWTRGREKLERTKQ